MVITPGLAFLSVSISGLLLPGPALASGNTF